MMMLHFTSGRNGYNHASIGENVGHPKIEGKE